MEDVPVSALFSFELPTHRVESEKEFVNADAVAELASSAERAGFSGIHVTDHPAPDSKWLDVGGHHALDPFVALSFAAAATSSVKLLTNIYVVSYRNPFLTAKSIQSLDLLSGGRFVLGTAAGYLKAEFAALGVDFDHRGEIMDENLDVICQALSGEDVAYEGAGFRARGVRLRPLPHGGRRPPIWIGGNSKAAIRRAAGYEGWAPFATAGYASASRTASIDDVDDLIEAIGFLKTARAQKERTDPFDICFSAGTLIDPSLSLDVRQDSLSRLGDAGVTWFTVSIPGDSRSEVIDGIERFSSEMQLRR
jgi:probable F420-dependent oxidoreductase